MPRADGAGWRHGIIRYGDNTLVFYKLSSIKPGPDSRMSRQGIEVRSRRAPEGSEFDIMTDDIVILEIVDNAATYEVALDSGARTAFLSWLESSLTNVRSAAVSGEPTPLRACAGLPEHIAVRVRESAEDEQQIRQPVEILRRKNVRVVGCSLDGRPGRAFRTASNGACRVQ